MITVYADGLCEPRNPGGTATYGYVIYRDSNGGSERHEGRGVVGYGRGISNNVAEYSGLCAALSWLLDHNLCKEEILVRSDSMLLVRQMGGEWACHGGMYVSKYKEALLLANQFKHISFEWVPREKNAEADALSRQAYEEYCREHSLDARYHDGTVAFKSEKQSQINSKSTLNQLEINPKSMSFVRASELPSRYLGVSRETAGSKNMQQKVLLEYEGSK